MAYINACKPYYSKYSNTGTTVTHSGGGIMSYLASVNFKPNTDSTKLYGDGRVIATTGNVFIDGELTLSLTSMPINVFKDLFPGNSETEESGTGVTFGGEPDPVYCSFGCVAEDVAADGDGATASNGTKRWRSMVLHKVEFQVPDITVNQREDSIAFQMVDLTGVVMRDDTDEHNWMSFYEFNNESDAVAFVKEKLGLSA